MKSDRLISVLLTAGLLLYSKHDPSFLAHNSELVIGLVSYWFGRTLGLNGHSNGSNGAGQ